MLEVDAPDYTDAQLEGDSPGEGGADPTKTGDAKAGDKGADKKGGDELDALRRELAQTKTSLAQVTESERYWAERARGGKDADGKADWDEPEDEFSAYRPKAEEADGDLDDPVKFSDALAEKGPAAIERALRARGFVPVDEVVKIAQQAAAKAAKSEVGKARADVDLVTKFPELQDAESELFKATGKIYREMVEADPGLKRSPAALGIAAKQAKLTLDLAKKAALGDDNLAESRRLQRIAAQAGDRGARAGATDFEGGDDDAIGPEAQRIIAQLARFGVTEKGFVEERRKMRAA